MYVLGYPGIEKEVWASLVRRGGYSQNAKYNKWHILLFNFHGFIKVLLTMYTTRTLGRRHDHI